MRSPAGCSFALGEDKIYAFNDEATSVIPYVLVRGVALAAGGPIGPAEDAAATVQSFCALCEENDWVPAFAMVEEKDLPLYKLPGLETLKTGEEALLEIPTFDTKGKARDDLRTAANRAKREGWQFRLFDRPVDDPALITQIKGLSESWLADKIGGEMGFMMGGSSITGSSDTLVSAVLDTAGKMLAFATWVPMSAVRGWADDYIRRAADAPNGVMEYIILATLEQLRQRGDLVVSLGLAPLANVGGENPEANSWRR